MRSENPKPGFKENMTISELCSLSVGKEGVMANTVRCGQKSQLNRQRGARADTLRPRGLTDNRRS